MITKVKRGDIFLADLSAYQGSEQKGVRPVLIIQNNKDNEHSSTTIVACLSSKIDNKAHLPTHYILPEGTGLKYRSMVLCEQTRIIDKNILLKKTTKLTKLDMKHINKKISISLELKDKKL